ACPPPPSNTTRVPPTAAGASDLGARETEAETSASTSARVTIALPTKRSGERPWRRRSSSAGCENLGPEGAASFWWGSAPAYSGLGDRAGAGGRSGVAETTPMASPTAKRSPTLQFQNTYPAAGLSTSNEAFEVSSTAMTSPVFVASPLGATSSIT